MAEELSSGQRSLDKESSGQVDQIKVAQVTGAQAGYILSCELGSGRLGHWRLAQGNSP